MKTTIVTILAIVSLLLSACTDSDVATITAPPYQGDQVLVFSGEVKNAGLTEIQIPVLMKGSATYKIVPALKGDEVGVDPTYDVFLHFNATLTGAVVEGDDCCVTCQSCDQVCVAKGTAGTLCKEYAVPAIADNVYLVVSFKLEANKLVLTRASLERKS